MENKNFNKFYLRFKNFIIILLILMGITVVLSFLWQKYNNRENLALLLPKDNTIAFVELNLNNTGTEKNLLDAKFKENPFLNEQLNLIQDLIPAKDLFYQWFNGKAGVAILTDDQTRSIYPVLFLGANQGEIIEKWFQQLQMDSDNEAIINEDFYNHRLISYQLGQIFHVLWLNDYLIIAEDKEPLRMIAETLNSNLEPLSNRADYGKLSSALPQQNLAFLFLDRSKILQTWQKNSSNLGQDISKIELYKPFLNLISSEAVSLQLIENFETGGSDIIGEQLSLFNENNQNPAAKSLFEQVTYFYTGKLDKYVPDTVLFETGGVNLLDQKNRLREFFEQSSQVSDVIFAGMINSFSEFLSTPEERANLESDFFPLLQKEYLFYITPKSNEDLNWVFLTQTDQPKNDKEKAIRLVKTVAPKILSPYFTSEETVTLPDGTEGKELVTSTLVAQENNLTINNEEVKELNYANQYSLYIWLSTTEKILVVSNSKLELEEVIKKSQETQNVNSESYELQQPTEVHFLDIEKLQNYLGGNSLLKPVTYLKVARKITPVGVLSSYKVGL